MIPNTPEKVVKSLLKNHESGVALMLIKSMFSNQNRRTQHEVMKLLEEHFKIIPAIVIDHGQD